MNTERRKQRKFLNYYEFYHLDGTESVPNDYKEISFVCLRLDGSLELPSVNLQGYLIKWQATIK